jgi:hypothetical protein
VDVGLDARGPAVSDTITSFYVEVHELQPGHHG